MEQSLFFGRMTSRTGLRAGLAATAIAAMPLQPSHAAGANLAIPPGAPSLVSFQAAAIGTNNQAYATYFGLKELTDPSGTVLTEETSTGVGATAYLDPVGNVIVAYAWDEYPAQDRLSSAILSGYGPSQEPGYGDALAFLGTVVAATTAEGIPNSRIYLTGFSLGAMLASYVGSQTGLPGVSYASCGIPGYKLSGAPADNFVNFVEANDPVAEYGTDTLEVGSAEAANPRMDHYGTVITLESPGAEERTFTSNITGFTLPEFFAGTLPIPPSQVATVEGEYYDLLGVNHQMSLYNPDSYALAQSYGISPTAP